MVQTVFPKSIVFFVSFGFENFYEFLRMPIFHAHAKLSVSNLCCHSQLFNAHLLSSLSGNMQSVGVRNQPSLKIDQKFSNAKETKKTIDLRKRVLTIVNYDL